MKKRVLWGFILFFTGLISLIFGGYFLLISLGYGCYLGGIEYINLAKAKGTRPSIRIVKFMIVAFMIAASIPGMGFSQILPICNFSPIAHFPILLTLGICLSFFRLLFRNENPPATNSDIATTILGFIYLGFLPSHLILIRNLCPSNLTNITQPWLQPGVAYLWATMFTIWSTDVFAYYFGKKLGKNLLYPQVSPKKTIEGSLGGLFAAIFFNTLVFYLSDYVIFKSQHPFNYQIYQAPFMAILVSIASQLGDLCESLLKRDAGVKNSSDIIPGHGGILDRGDSVIFGGAVAYYWINVLILHNF